ncbi:MAG: Holliday junction resolvase RuvX [Chlamydiales bacterium]
MKDRRILGIDYGLARIGLSLSDATGILATPWATLKSDKKIENTLKLLLNEIERIKQEKECEIHEIVIGNPLHMSGQQSALADEVKNFVALMNEYAPAIDIILWDERLTSVQAERSLRESGMTRKKRSKVVDSVAAIIILQSYLDRKNLMGS